MKTTKEEQSQTPISDSKELDNAHFSDWGFGPSGYVEIEDMRKLELSFNNHKNLLIRFIIEYGHRDSDDNLKDEQPELVREAMELINYRK